MIKYYGGKIWLSKTIENYLPKNGNINCFVDLFVGGGSISDTLCNVYEKCIVNDMDENLINLYRVVKEGDMEKIIEIFEKLREETLFEDVRKLKQSLDCETNKIFRAFNYYTCVYCGYGGKPYASPTRDKYNQYKRRNIRKDIEFIYKTISKCEIYSKDYSDIIYNNCLYYCDPPYNKVGDNTYYGLKGKTHKDFDHLKFYNYIKEISKNNYTIISYEDSRPIRELYKDFNIISISKKTVNFNPNSKNNETLQTNELLIMNY